MSAIATPDDVYTFWFGPTPGVERSEWFEKNAEFDLTNRERFAATHDHVHRGAADHWLQAPRSALAYVIVLDQFSRNMYRDTPRAFASDDRALSAAREIVAKGWDRTLAPRERQFAYLPFEHSEEVAMQAESIRLFGELELLPETKGLLEWARKHAVIIERFGRFPHRNVLLGRTSTLQELEFLKQADSSF
ncbi:MAG: DUF924 family protein [Burkholderiales bacterium]